MKKGSTAGGQQLSHFYRQKLTMGLDLGDRSAHYNLPIAKADRPQRRPPLNRAGARLASDFFRVAANPPGNVGHRTLNAASPFTSS